ncbi:MAG: ribose 5-phosphate isomerase B [Ignavibacteria bacterium]|nr:ribose 5-phosphate isomerase B [Ignavibacteria bacterium]
MKIAIGNDHAGNDLKLFLMPLLVEFGHEVKDFGSHSNESVDYPEYGHKVARAINNKEYDIGITICGTGNGMIMAANKYPNVRSALCWSEEIGRLARSHNNANICALPGRFISNEEALVIIRAFLETNFEGGRHKRRINKIPLKNTL